MLEEWLDGSNVEIDLRWLDRVWEERRWKQFGRPSALEWVLGRYA